MAVLLWSGLFSGDVAVTYRSKSSRPRRRIQQHTKCPGQSFDAAYANVRGLPVMLCSTSPEVLAKSSPKHFPSFHSTWSLLLLFQARTTCSATPGSVYSLIMHNGVYKGIVSWISAGGREERTRDRAGRRYPLPSHCGFGFVPSPLTGHAMIVPDL